jgi:hypothetical protein
MDLLPTESNEKSLSDVCSAMGALGRSPLAAFVSQSSRGAFDAASQMLNQLERDLPLKLVEVSGTQLAKQKTFCINSTTSFLCGALVVLALCCEVVSYVSLCLQPWVFNA